jgi:hypothetical protein
MIKGTTPTHTFSLPFGTELIKTIEITYAQSGTVVLTKGNTDCTFEENDVSVRLSQEDTFLFADGTCVEIQVRVLTLGGDAIASPVMRVHCHDCLSCEVLA